jgi:hypothetical protein
LPSCAARQNEQTLKIAERAGNYAELAFSENGNYIPCIYHPLMAGWLVEKLGDEEMR